MKFLLMFSLLAFSAAERSFSGAWCNRQSMKEAFETAFELKVKNSLEFQGESRIVGGQPASRGQFGFFVMLESFDGRWQTPCGGALIRFNWVLTAGQCIVCARSILASFGQVDRNGGPISWITHISNPDHILYHQDYNPWNFQGNPFVNDIGLIYLVEAREPMLLPFVNTIDFSFDTSNDFLNTPAVTMGFGTTQDSASHLSLQLNYVEMRVISNALCNETFTNVIEESNLCTETNNSGPCQGDAGGPLIISDENANFVLIGVVSFRHRDGCGLGHPAVFTRVTSHITWINSIIDSTPQVPAPPSPEPPNGDDKCNCHCHTCPYSPKLEL